MAAAGLFAACGSDDSTTTPGTIDGGADATGGSHDANAADQSSGVDGSGSRDSGGSGDAASVDANMSDATVTDAGTSDGNTIDAGMSDANAIDANTTDADMTDADMTDADMTDADMTDADMTDADMTDADMTDADMTDANASDASALDAGLADAGPDAEPFSCNGCPSFPPPGTTACAPATLGPATIAYPLDGMLLPPNLGYLEVQFVPPAGATLFEVDFENAVTDVRVEATCNQITPVRGGASPGCGVSLSPTEWSAIANANRDGDPVQVTVRTTIDGSCVSTSTTSVAVSFANDDLTGGIYFWQSEKYNGIDAKTGGIQAYDFGAPAASATPVLTPGAINTCIGCHTVSRDGVSMSSTFDDADGDDEYGEAKVQVINLGTRTDLGGLNISPGFQTFTHDHSKLVASNFKTGMNKSFEVFDSNGKLVLATLMPPAIATQPDLSADDTTLVYVVPSSLSGFGFSMQGDHHFYGGSLWMSRFDSPSNTISGSFQLLGSSGTPPNATNFYYPSISPDGAFVAFDAAPSGDAFHNPNARVKLLHLPATTNPSPIDLPALNVADGLTNSWPRWSPFVQTYKGHKLLWVTFSSTRDYGLYLANAGLPNCYPPESPLYDQPQEGAGMTYLGCTWPQIWMAAMIVDPDPSLDATDRSFPAFWLPAQNPNHHNHTAQWTDNVVVTSPATCSGQGTACGGASALCCSDTVCCQGTCAYTCIQ
jgi:uncharacterized protein YjbI with pentapeptide repeats